MNSLIFRNKTIKFPMFFPDATYGHVVALDNRELSKTGIKGVVVNTYHFLKSGLIDKPKYAMGVGKPEDLIVCVKLGYDMFDCVIPTRDARHKRLYVFDKKPLKGKLSFKEFNIKSKMIKDKSKVSRYCDCELCKKYTRSDLYKMFRDRDDNARRLATIHNLTLYSKVMEMLRK